MPLIFRMIAFPGISPAADMAWYEIRPGSELFRVPGINRRRHKKENHRTNAGDKDTEYVAFHNSEMTVFEFKCYGTTISGLLRRNSICGAQRQI